MRKGLTTVRTMLVITAIIMLIFLLMQPLTLYHFRDYIDVLFPTGTVAVEQRNLLLILQGIMLLVIIPVYIFTFIFSWKYRASNPNAKYDPHLIDNTLAECIWWGIPLILTVIIGALTWVETYRLDPFKPLISDKKTMTIQVVALQWKWLFIYPGEQIATLNFVQFPKDQPIRFEITADAPMNSFWIPDLGGQIYAMPKMKTELNLIANQVGDFRGSSANISGEGFAGMHFIARASTEEDYKNWVQAARNSSKALTFEEYNKIAAPSKNDLPATYVLKDDHLFHQILMKFMQPQQKPQLKQPMGNE